MASTQNIALPSSSANLAVASNTTTGNVTIGGALTTGSFDLGAAQTDGTIAIGAGAARTATGVIAIGDASLPNTYVDLGAGTITATGGTTATVTAGLNARTYTTVETNIGHNQTSGTVNIGSQLTTGSVYIAHTSQPGVGILELLGDTTIGVGAARTGTITIGNSAKSNSLNMAMATVAITGGTTTTITGPDTLSVGGAAQTSAITIGNLLETGTIAIGAVQTTGTIAIGTGAARTVEGPITIGNSATPDVVSIKSVNMNTITGTFSTPTLIGTTSGTFTNVVASGTWVKWGRMFEFSLTLVYETIGSALGNIRITNMPYSGASGSVTVMIQTITFLSTPASPVYVRTVANQKYVDIYRGESTLGVGSVDTGGSNTIKVSGAYCVLDT